jgi:pantoate--beta-alanine ligase
MHVIETIQQCKLIIQNAKKEGKSIGFAPTMGALHQGHLELIRKAKKRNDFVVASIFVNPIQFNNKEDLDKYPRTQQQDLEYLEENQCDLAFVPTVEEMYPETNSTKYNFGDLENLMEGRHRPGHFNGVAIVVKQLFDIIEPDQAYFGEKDFQQLIIIQKLVEMEKIPVEIVPCATVREEDGLAMSSRNRRLSPAERNLASVLNRVLTKAKEMLADSSPEKVKAWASKQIASYNEFDLEYFEIADAFTLKPVSNKNSHQKIVMCLAAHLGKVRLIDNVVINC